MILFLLSFLRMKYELQIEGKSKNDQMQKQEQQLRGLLNSIIKLSTMCYTEPVSIERSV